MYSPRAGSADSHIEYFRSRYLCEQDGSFESNGEEGSYHKITKETEGVYSTDYGWGLFKDDEANSRIKGSRYCRTYAWNERNLLISSVDANYNTAYVYGQDGQRTNKYTQSSETLYFNKMWTHHTDSGNNVYGGQTSKNIYLGETRIVTKLNSGSEPKYQEEYYKQYYYHSDHLGSASLISDYKGEEYQRIEYTPYGETWVEKTNPHSNLNFLPYKFTAKEMDEETGLYYYGARYLDPQYSMWISTDPALGEYIPKAPVNEEAKRYNQNLPGMGGVFNSVNLNLYHYAANNPVKYTDPDGKTNVYFIFTFGENDDTMLLSEMWSQFGNFKDTILSGVSAKLIIRGTQNDILQAIQDPECYAVITSGHGCNDGTICTADNLYFSQSDIDKTKLSKNLKLVIFENCYQGDFEKEWEAAFGGNVDVVGWSEKTTTTETIFFNTIGIFDRQEKNISSYLSYIKACVWMDRLEKAWDSLVKFITE